MTTNNLRAVALCNNATAMLAWVWDGIIEDCLGFSIERTNTKTGETTVLGSRHIKFKGEDKDKKSGSTTDEHPIQGCKWSDPGAEEGGTYQWTIYPMIGTPGNLKRGEGVKTNVATLGVDYGPYIKACFNRGHLVSTQKLADLLPKLADGTPDPEALVKAINDPESAIYKWLGSSLPAFVRLPFEEAKQIAGHVFALYYELSSPVFVEYLRANEDVWSMVLGNTGKHDITNAATRKQLHEDGADVTDRFVEDSMIAHNKSAILASGDGKGKGPRKGRKWMLQSINPTPTGFCTQANHAIYIDSPALADVGLAYYDRVKADCSADPIQSDELRAANRNVMKPIDLGDGTKVQAIFSPSSEKREKPKLEEGGKTFDLLNYAVSTKRVKEILLKAKQGIYFVAFYPGAPSFLDVVTWLQYKHPGMPIMGTVSSTQALPRPPRRKGSGTGKTGTKSGSGTKAGINPQTAIPSGMTETASGLVVPAGLAPASAVDASEAPPLVAVPQPVAVFQPRKKFPTIIAASALEQGWQEWHKELLKLPDAHAITHSKVIVVDPFGDNPWVLGAASDQLGLKCGCLNDETMLAIQGNRALALGYWVHIMDVYNHFQWRYLVSTGQSNFKGELDDTATWQRKYQWGKMRAQYLDIVEGSGLLPE